MEDILIYIDDKEKLDASVVANSFSDNEIKNRAYINTLGADLLSKYLALENIDTSKTYNIHSIKRILEDTDISDIRLDNISIDVRVIFDENIIFIPKSHFEFEITPDIYVVFHLSQDFSHVKFLGFFEPKLINKNNQNEEYYFIEREKLIPAHEFIKFINSQEKTEYQRLTEEELTNSEQIMVSMADYEVTQEEKAYLLKQLIKSTALRDRFIEYENFETLANKAANNLETIKQSFENFEDDIFEDFNDITNIDTQVSEDTELATENFDNLESINLETYTDNVETLTTETQDLENLIDFENINIGNETSSEEIITSEQDIISLEDIKLGETLEPIQENINLNEIQSDYTENITEQNFELETLPLIENTIETSEVLEDFSEDIYSDSEATTTLENIELDNLEKIEIEDVDTNFKTTISENNSEFEPNEILENIENLNLTDDLNSAQSNEYNSINIDENIIEDIELNELNNINESPIDINNESIQNEIYNDLEENIELNEIPEMNFETEQIENTISQNNNSKDFNDDELDDIVANIINEQENNPNSEITPESFGKNLLENLSAEELDSIPLEELGINTENTGEIAPNKDLLSKIDDALDSNTQIIEPTTIDDNLISDYNNETETSEADIPENLEVLFDSQVANEEQIETEVFEEPEVTQNYYENPKNNSAKAIFVTLLITAIIGASAFFILKPKDEISNNIEEEIDIINTPSTNSTESLLEPPVADEGSKKVEANIPTAQINKEEIQKVKQQEYTPKKIPSDAPYLTVNRLVWNISNNLSDNPKFQNYLKTVGKSIKLSLSADLLLATEYAYTNQVKVSLKINKNGSIESANITSSCGSNEIDNIVLQSVKETLNVVKPPSEVINTPNFDLNLTIYL